VKRGPIVYCMESVDLKKDNSVFALALSSAPSFKSIAIKIANANVIVLETTAKKIDDAKWNDQLYKELSKKPGEDIAIKLVPYFAWGNRGHVEMSVWLPVR